MISYRGAEKKSVPFGTLFLRVFTHLHDGEELDKEQRGNHVGQNADILSLAGEHLDKGVGDEAQADGVADGAGDRHTDEHDGHRQHLVHVAEVHILEALEHQNADIDQRGGGRSAGDDGGDGGEEHAGEEQDARGERGRRPPRRRRIR